MNDRNQIHLQQARAFNKDALAAIYDDYHQAIYRYVYRQVSEQQRLSRLKTAIS